MRSLIFFCAFCLLLSYDASAQFDVQAYKRFLDSTKDYSYEKLVDRFSAGTFLDTISVDMKSVQYLDTGVTAFKLTAGELELARKHGFVVSSRVEMQDFNFGFLNVFRKDLPVYISSDALLHAIHTSYDHILRLLESDLAFSLEYSLKQMREELQRQSQQAAPDSLSEQARLDADLYLSVGLQLLQRSWDTIAVYYPANARGKDSIISLINAEQPSAYKLFSSSERLIDWSQFKPRGHYLHYSDSYFRAMTWLGKTELYITSPKSQQEVSANDIRRQCALSLQLLDLVKHSGAGGPDGLSKLERVLRVFVGPQDNLSLDSLQNIVQSLSLNISYLQDSNKLHEFQQRAIAAGAQQNILSQLLEANGKDTVKPAAAFLLMGQRFVIDSYIFSQLVDDKVPSRMMPKSLDALFCLGNNSALQFLRDEVNAFNYAPNLAATRYMLDSYTASDWYSSVYASRLNLLQSLNPPSMSARSLLPPFMQTSAWWQKNLNTELAAWAELRHDYLLYAKQSYTDISACYYPKGFVEPCPQFYAALGRLNKLVTNFMHKVDSSSYIVTVVLPNIDTVCTRLQHIAEKEIQHVELDSAEREMIDTWIFRSESCTGLYFDGWYARLQFDVNLELQNPLIDYCVADVHTQPSDEAGNIVGKVLHVGCGAPNLALVIAQDAEGCTNAYYGPVSSYYEFTSINFQRLSDEEWQNVYSAQGVRPALTKLYMADASGSEQAGAPKLFLGLNEDEATTNIQLTNYPNPFTSGTTIGFILPSDLGSHTASLRIYDIEGKLVRELVNSTMQPGNYLVRWDGLSSKGEQLNSGSYFYQLEIGKQHFGGSMLLRR